VTGALGKYTLLRELKGCDAPTYAARVAGTEPGTGGAAELVVLDRYTGAGLEQQEALDEAVVQAKLWTEFEHDNVARVKEVLPSKSEVLVVSAFVDGQRYAEILASREAFDRSSFGLKLAIVTDVIEGLAKLHALASSRRSSTVHGAVTPHNIIVCSDGHARLVRVCNLFPEQLSPVNPALGYFAPERLDPSRMPDASGDVYGLGVMLWEVVCGKRLAVQTNLTSLLLREFEGGKPPKGIPPEELAWGKHLVPVVKRALAPLPERYPTAEAMAVDLRAALSEGKRASSEDVARHIEEHHGEQIRARRADLSTCEPKPTSVARATMAPKRSSRPLGSGPDDSQARAAAQQVEVIPAPPLVAKVDVPADADEKAEEPRLAPPPVILSEAKDPPAPKATPLPPPTIVLEPEPQRIDTPMTASASSAGIEEPNRKKKGVWIGVLAVAAAVVLFTGYRLRYREPPPAPVAAGPSVPAPAPSASGEATEVGDLEEQDPGTAASGEATREIELVPDSPTRPSAHHRRGGRPAPSASSGERRKFNPQGI
jgi:serine/threonine protein kinase